MALSTTPNGYLPTRHPKRLARVYDIGASNERENDEPKPEPTLTYDAWDTVVRELQDKAARLAERDITPDVQRQLEDLCRLIADVQRVWTEDK